MLIKKLEFSVWLSWSLGFTIVFHPCSGFSESSHLPTSSIPMFNMPVKKQIDDHDSHASDLSNCTQPTVEHPQWCLSKRGVSDEELANKYICIIWNLNKVLSKKNTYLLLKAGLQGSGQELKAPEAGQACPIDLYYLIWLSVPRPCNLPEIDPCFFNSIHVWCLDQLILFFEAVGILRALQVHCRGCPEQQDYKITRNELLKGNETQFSHLWNPITRTMEWWREYQNRSQTCNKLMKVNCCVCTTLIATHYWHLNEPALQFQILDTILNWGKRNNPIKHGLVQKLCYQTQFSKANFSSVDTNRQI